MLKKTDLDGVVCDLRLMDPLEETKISLLSHGK